MKTARVMPNNKEKRSFYTDKALYNLLMGFKNAIMNYNTSAVFIVDGRSGHGKTTLSNQIGIILDRTYDLNKIHYSPQTFLEGTEGKIGLKNAKKGDFILFDEAMLISNRSSLTSINRMIIQAMSMIRSKNIYVCFCVNSIFDLDRNLAISRADLLLHVYGESLISRGKFAAFFKGKDGFDRIKQLYLLGKKYYNYNQPRANCVGRFVSEFVVDEKIYEEQKQKGINEFLSGPTKPLGKLAKRWLEINKRLIKYLYHEVKLRIVDIEKISGIDNSELSKIINYSDVPTPTLS